MKNSTFSYSVTVILIPLVRCFIPDTDGEVDEYEDADTTGAEFEILTERNKCDKDDNPINYSLEGKKLTSNSDSVK